MTEQTFQFQTTDEKQQQLTEEFGLILLQLTLILKRFALAGDSQAVLFFDDYFNQIINAARAILKEKAN